MAIAAKTNGIPLAPNVGLRMTLTSRSGHGLANRLGNGPAGGGLITLGETIE